MVPSSSVPVATFDMTVSRRTAAVSLGLYAPLACFIVFWPTSDVASESVRVLRTALLGLGAPTWVSLEAIEFVTNVLLFMPLSFFGSAFRPRWSWLAWGLVGLATTLVIEGLQLLLLPDRSPATADLVANTLGSVLGFGTAVLVRRWDRT